MLLPWMSMVFAGIVENGRANPCLNWKILNE